jgi:hypothetical protein
MTEVVVESADGQAMLSASAIQPDLNEAARFLDVLGLGASGVTFQEYDDWKLGRLWKPVHGTLDALAAELLARNVQGAAIALCINETDGTGRKTENIVRVRAVWIDGDGLPIDALKHCPLPPHVVVGSSPGNHHAYWRVSDCPLEMFSQVQDALADHFGVASSVNDLTHPMRMPGFLHQKDPARPFISSIVDGVGTPDRPPYALEEIIDGLKLASRPAKQLSQGFDDSDSAAGMREWTNNILDGNLLHINCRNIAASLVRQGVPGGTVVNHLRVLMERSEARKERPTKWKLRYDEIPGLVSGALEKFPPVPPEERPSAEHGRQQAEAILPSATRPNEWPDFSTEELAKQPEPLWLIEGLIQENSIGLMVGAWSAGKSFLAAYLCDSLCSGSEFFGLYVDRSAGKQQCLYIALEAQSGWIARNRAMVANGRGAGIRWLLPKTFNIRDDADRQRLVDFVAVKGPFALLVIDTMAKATPGTVENANEEMSAVVAAIEDIRDRTGSTVMAVHHFGKDPSRGARGASSLPGGLDFEIDVFRDGKARYWTNGKVREGDDEKAKNRFTLDVTDLGLNRRGRPMSSCVVQPTEDEARARVRSSLPAPTGKHQKPVLAAMRKAAKAGGSVNNRIGTWDQAMDIATSAVADSDRPKERAKDALNSLLKTGHIHHGEDGVVWLTV